MKHLLAVLLLCISVNSMAQKITVKFNKITLKDALHKLEKKTIDRSFSYNNNLKELHKKINKSYKNKTLYEILNDLLKSEKLTYKKIGNTIIIYAKSKKDKKKNKIISGYIFDEKSGEVLIGATIFSVETGKGTNTNNYGFYSLSLPEKNNTVSVSYVGYKNKILTVKNKRQDIYLVIDNSKLNEIEIKATKNKLRKKYAGALNISSSEIKKIPLLSGEPDVLKAIQQQNGIRTVNDGSSFYFVRGGNFDQNLVLLDEAPLYNNSHLLGMVSVINGDIIKNTKFYKGFFPTKYSGRLASVLDITTKDGNKKNFQLSGGISTLGVRLAAEGPIIKNKISYIISGRKSLLDLLARNTEVLSPNYYDINTKVNWKINKNNNLLFSFYNGKDIYTLKGSFFNVKTINHFATIRWNHIFNEKLFANTSLIYNEFKGDYTISNDADNWKSNIKEVHLKYQLSYYLNNRHTFNAGVKTGFHNYQPGLYENLNINFGTKKLNSLNIFTNHKTQINSNLSLDYGINFNLTNALGKARLITLDSDFNVSNTFQNDGGVYKTWAGIEPRINLLYKFNKYNRSYTSYSKMRQFVHSPHPYKNDFSIINLWVPTSNNVDPLSSNIFSVGYDYSYGNFGINIEGYYKDIKNQLDYVPYPDIRDTNYERYLRRGNVTSYGMELGLGYKTEKIHLKADYSYSKTTVKNKYLNNGEKYITRYDIPHQLNLLGTFNFTKRLDFTTTWVYKTGRPYTLPVAVQLLNGGKSLIPLYGKRYNARLEDYHRLDFMFTLKPKISKKGWKGTWNAGITNAYAQLNPITIRDNLQNIGEDNKFKLEGGNVFRLFPILSYSFQF
ncbi:TonB-dependent receptor domain-containing protein [Tenacibaculum sp. C7A-26P2]|uniref:TonB-dependent receptor domain-containing protein n=1 Tax=Tenacibaculum sp. C7A-26P2 TaxID=3447504 RepID=UPI003F877AA0